LYQNTVTFRWCDGPLWGPYTLLSVEDEQKRFIPWLETRNYQDITIVYWNNNLLTQKKLIRSVHKKLIQLDSRIIWKKAVD